MAVTYSEMLDLGTQAPAFELACVNPEVDDREAETRSLDDFAGAQALVVVFTCNHCPYAKHVEEALLETARVYQARGVQVVAICSNDPERYPADAPAALARRAREKVYPFPYLFDETQDVARAYHAVCTPDFFVFDADRCLAYRGRMDATRPGQGRATGEELRQALDQLLDEGEVARPQHPAMGCNIKWRPNGR